MNETRAIIGAVIDLLADKEFGRRLKLTLQHHFAEYSTGRATRDETIEAGAQSYHELLTKYFLDRNVPSDLAEALVSIFVYGNRIGLQIVQEGPGKMNDLLRK